VIQPEKTPAKNLAELIALAKAQPGALTFGSAGNGNVTHLFGELFRRAAGVDIRHVPYKGTGPALTDLQGGQITMLMAGPGGVRPLIAAGRLRPLALTGQDAAIAGLGDVPTFAQAGVPMPETDMGAWQGLFAPRGTPRETIAQINRAVHTVLAQPEMRTYLTSIATAPNPTTPEALGALLASQTRVWGQVIAQAGITPG
jgi:tripartite-type tricarboxylate transporter receptor subunit TctC